AAAPGPGASPLPAGLLLACRPRSERGPLRLLPRASHPAVTHDARRGGDRPSRTNPSTTPSTSVEPQRCLPLSLMHPHFAPSRRSRRAPPRDQARPARAPVPTRPDLDDRHRRELLPGFGLTHDHRPPPMQIDPDELPTVILVHRGLPRFVE